MKKFFSVVFGNPFIAIISIIFIIITMNFILLKCNNTNKTLPPKIDSLNIISKRLYEMQKKLDNSTNMFRDSIKNLNKKLEDENNNQLIIREYYHEKSTAVDKYTHAELEDFFTKRYGY